MKQIQLLCALGASLACVQAANADIFFLGGTVAGTTTGAGKRTIDDSPLDLTTNPAQVEIQPTGGAGATSGGLADAATLVASSTLGYNLSAGTASSSDFVRILVDASAYFDDHGGMYEGSIGSQGTAIGSFRYTGPAMPFFARRVVDGVPIPGPWFTPIPGTGASLDGGIITPGDYSFSLLATVDSMTNTSETRLSELVIPAPASLAVLAIGLCASRRRR